MGSPFIFSGNNAKSLKPNLDLNGVVSIQSGSADPTQTATSGNKGSMYMSTLTGAQYMKLDSSTSTNWVRLTPNGLKNYIPNYDFESTTTAGWSLGTTGTLTNGLPTGTPTFGSGAAGTLSFAPSSSAFFLISGTTSGSLVSSAGTTPAGNMLHTASMAIDPSDRAKVLNLKFNYLFANAANCNLSGTSSNTFGIAAYDETNSSWIPVVGAFNIVQSSGVGTATATLQTNSTTASLRFCFYMANAASGIYSLGVDDFYLGPQVIATGAAMTDWVSYTPTFVGFGTVTPGVMYSRRVGGNLEVQGYFTAGTPTATLASMSLGFNGANASVSADLNKIPVNGLIGEAYVNNSGTYSWSVLSPTSGNLNTVNFGIQGASNSAGTAANGSALLGAGANLQLRFSVPIVGWSSNVQQSSDSDQRTIAASFYGTPTGTINTSTNNIVLPAPTISGGSYNASTGVYTVGVTGYYFIAGDFNLTIGNNTSNTFITVNQTGSVSRGFTFANTVPASTVGGQTINGSVMFYCNAGDTLYFSIGTNQTSISYGTCSASIIRLSGSAVVQATESVYASYYGNATANGVPNNTTTTLSNTYLTYGKLADSHNAFNTTTGVYTCPSSGAYEVTGSVIFAANATGIRDFICTQAGSASFTLVTSVPGSANGAIGATGSFIFKCNAGDTLAMQGYQNSGGALVIGNTCVFGIKRIGN